MTAQHVSTPWQYEHTNLDTESTEVCALTDVFSRLPNRISVWHAARNWTRRAEARAELEKYV